MIIDLHRKFIFVANLKTASTAIEAVLRPYADIALCESRLGKHLPFSDIEARFGWVFDLADRSEYFVFGVMRDPVDYVVSLYNSHTHPRFADDPNLYTGGMAFDRFLDAWSATNPEQMTPQCERFVARDGTIGADYIVSYARLAEGLNYVADSIGVPALRYPPRIEVSPRRFCREELSADQLASIARRFDRDIAFMEKFCDRVLDRDIYPVDGLTRVTYWLANWIRNCLVKRKYHGRRNRKYVGRGEDNVSDIGADISAQPASDAEAVAVATAGHDEAEAVAVETAGQAEAAPAAKTASEVITALYRSLFLREPDPSGLQTYVDSIDSGTPLEDVVRDLLRSQEFRDKLEQFLHAYVPADSGRGP